MKSVLFVLQPSVPTHVKQAQGQDPPGPLKRLRGRWLAGVFTPVVLHCMSDNDDNGDNVTSGSLLLSVCSAGVTCFGSRGSKHSPGKRRSIRPLLPVISGFFLGS